MIATAMLLQAGVSCCLATSLSVYVAMLQRKSGAQWTLFATLLCIAAWTAGAALAWSAPESSGGVHVAILMVFFGSCFVPGLTFYLAARCTQLSIVEQQPVATILACLLPGSLAYAMLLTNSLHGLFLVSTGFEVFRGSASDWAGPAFWIHLVVSYSFIMAAMVLSGHAACGAGPSLERRRLVLLTVSSAVPLIANAVYVFGLAPISFPLTYAGLGVTGLLLVVAIARYGLLESFVPAIDVIAHLRAGIILADADGRVVRTNTAAESLVGRSAAAMKGRSLSESIDSLDLSGALPRLVADQTEKKPLVTTVETPQGYVIEIHAGSVRSRKGTITARFLVLDDHTAERRYERLRQRVERLDAIGALVAGLSHEINNPLAFVMANLAHVLRTTKTVQRELEEVDAGPIADIVDIGEAAEEALVGLQRIHEIVASTKNLLRDPRARRELVDVNQIVRDSLALSGLDRECGLPLVLRLHSAPLTVLGSAVQLGQMVLNLIVNARDAVAGAPDSQILVETRPCRTCEQCRGGAELRISDTGAGVPAEHRGKIFAPFFTTKSPGEGTGLGLAICAEIARDHGGVIDVSTGQLGGACFAVRLPCEDREC